MIEPGDKCPVCGEAGAVCGGPTVSRPVDVPVATIRQGGMMADLVRVQFGPRDIRQVTREQAREMVKAGTGVLLDDVELGTSSALERATDERILPHQGERVLLPEPTGDGAAPMVLTVEEQEFIAAARAAGGTIEEFFDAAVERAAGRDETVNVGEPVTDLGQGAHTVATTSTVLRSAAAPAVEVPQEGAESEDGMEDVDDGSGADKPATGQESASGDPLTETIADLDSEPDSKAVDGPPADKAANTGRIPPRRRGGS